MIYAFISMCNKYAQKIAYEWKYDGIYSFYDMTEDEEDLHEFLDCSNWDKSIFAVLDDKKNLIGYYDYNFEDGFMEIGFGLKPELTGIGLGHEFVKQGISFGIQRFKYNKNSIYLSVAAFNIRAIKLYKKLGFRETKRYMQKTNGGEYEFIRMKLTRGC